MLWIPEDAAHVSSKGGRRMGRTCGAIGFGSRALRWTARDGAAYPEPVI
jgi:hypothetical protein